MKVTILGYGRMGQAIAHGFHVLGHQVSTVDYKYQGSPYPHQCLIIDDANIAIDRAQSDIVVSSLPYCNNLSVAETCIKKKVPYFDLGGHVETSQKINELAIKEKAPVFTDLGLAPGWVNIQAEEVWSKMQCECDSIKMYCGGLPVSRSVNPLGYTSTWSIDGLLNEYNGSCHFLRDGEKHQIEGMHLYELINLDGWAYEAFCTSGAMSHTLNLMKNRGVQNCVYKTLRYTGHRDLFYWLSRHLTSSELEKLLKTDSADHVITYVEGSQDGNKVSQVRRVYGDKQFTAMQRATAFPLVAAVLSLVPQLSLIERPFNYSDIPLASFNQILEQLL